jgi:hypothetical protein
MDKHVQIIAILWIISGILGLLLGFFVFLALFGVSFIPNMGDIAPGILRLVAWIISLFFMTLTLPQIVGGVALLQRKEWGRILVLVVSFFHLVNFPFGTALAVYSLVILLREDTVRLFRTSS